MENFILTIKDFLYLITIKTLIVAVAASGATIYCIENEFVTEIPISLIGLAVVFPLVFTIGTAFQRRDLALKEYGAINSNFAEIVVFAKVFIFLLISICSCQSYWLLRPGALCLRTWLR